MDDEKHANQNKPQSNDSDYIQHWRNRGLILSLSEGDGRSLAYHIGSCLAWYKLGLLPYVGVLTGSGYGNVALLILILWGTNVYLDDELQDPQFPRECLETCLGCRKFPPVHSISSAWRRWENRVRWRHVNCTTYCGIHLNRKKEQEQTPPYPLWIRGMLTHAQKLAGKNLERDTLVSRMTNFYSRLFSKNLAMDTRDFFRSNIRLHSSPKYEETHSILDILTDKTHRNEPIIFFGGSIDASEYTHGSAAELDILAKSRQPHEVPTGRCPIFLTNDTGYTYITLTDRARLMKLDINTHLTDILPAVALPPSWGGSTIPGSMSTVINNSREVDPYGISAAQNVFVTDRMYVGGQARWLLSDTWTSTFSYRNQPGALINAHEGMIQGRTMRNYRSNIREQSIHSIRNESSIPNGQRCDFFEHERSRDDLIAFRGNISQAAIPYQQRPVYMLMAEEIAQDDIGLTTVGTEEFEEFVNWGFIRTLAAHADDRCGPRPFNTNDREDSVLHITSPPVIEEGGTWNPWYELPYSAHRTASMMKRDF